MIIVIWVSVLLEFATDYTLVYLVHSRHCCSFLSTPNRCWSDRIGKMILKWAAIVRLFDTDHVNKIGQNEINIESSSRWEREGNDWTTLRILIKCMDWWLASPSCLGRKSRTSSSSNRRRASRVNLEADEVALNSR